MVDNALFSSKSLEWETPQWLFDTLDNEFKFDVDVCASPVNHKLIPYLDIHRNSLTIPWSEHYRTCWMNPPYGRGIGKWMCKAYEESLKGCTVVCLVPSRTGTRWFHDWVLGKADIRFLKGRLKFGSSKNSAPFDSILAIYRGTQHTPKGDHRA